MNPLNTIKRRGIGGTLAYTLEWARRQAGWHAYRVRNVPRYQNPTSDELLQIERQLLALGVELEDYYADPDAFRKFQNADYFPIDYHGGKDGGVWDEKFLEHFIAADLLDLWHYVADDLYVDVAACNSPWAVALRDRNINSFAIDLAVGAAYQGLPYYRRENATATSFSDASVRGASLHCAFEMFMGNDDSEFIREAARILVPGGKIVILPLYMHTHYCAYSTPEYWGRGHSDPNAKEYVRLDCWGVPSSRKYGASILKSRILDLIAAHGMGYRLLALRNKEALGRGIYCHFILEITR